MSQVVRPVLPYRGCIPNGLHDGKLIEIRGSVPYGASGFEINLLTGLDPSSDRALHMSVRFHERTVVSNTLQHNAWGVEERHGHFPFHSGKDFYIMILVEPTTYRVAVDHQHLFEFAHRIPISRVTSILIDGSVKIERIEFIDKQISYPTRMPMNKLNICPSRPTTTSTTVPPFYDQFVPGVPRIDPYFCPSSARFSGYGNPGFKFTPQPIPNVGPFPNPGVVGGCIIPPPEQIAVCPAYRPQPAATVSSNLAPVYNPPIPYAYPIYGGLKPGMMIYISGRPSASAYRFSLNIQAGTAPYPPPDIAFHFDARFYSHSIVRNSRINNTWGQEENLSSHFPFQPAVNFDMIIKVENDRYMIALNGQHFLEFRHRMQPLSQFDTLFIENDIVVSSIRFA